MAVASAKKKAFETMADVIRDLGVSPKRIRINPLPGRATVDDLIRINERQDRIYELVDAILVEKIMGARESMLAARLIMLLGVFVTKHKLGFVLAPDATLRIAVSLVRAPDVCFIRRNKFVDGKFPIEPVPNLVPDLAIEILSRSNRPAEMNRKLEEYFASGVTLVWFIDPQTETAEVFAAVDASSVLTRDQSLGGGELLPGFRLPLTELFADLDEPAVPKKSNGKRKKRG